MEAIRKEATATNWFRQTGFMGGKATQGDGKIYRQNGIEGLVCPHCATFIPLRADVCTGCGATKAPFNDNQTWGCLGKFAVGLVVAFVIFIVVLLMIYGVP